MNIHDFWDRLVCVLPDPIDCMMEEIDNIILEIQDYERECQLQVFLFLYPHFIRASKLPQIEFQACRTGSRRG
jgi:hypothetical protein